MRLTPLARLRALAVMRHAAVAAGLGLGWLLLSGSAASALDDPLGAGSLLGTSPPTSSVTAPITSTAATVTRAPATSIQASSALAQGTTTAVASTAQALPSSATPVLTGPLAPLAPGVTGTTSDVGKTINSVGNTLGDTVSAPLPVPAPVPVPAPPPLADQLTVPPSIDPAAPPAAPAADQAAAAAEVRPASTSPDGPTAETLVIGNSATSRPLDAVGYLLAWDWSVSRSVLATSVMATPGALISAASGSPGDVPDGPSIFPPIDHPMWLGSSTSGSSGGGLLNIGMLASALMLVPILLASRRKRHAGGRVPPSPAFDPGSTPD